MIAKRKDSLYSPGKRTKDWAAIRNLMDDDYIICSYVSNAESVASLVPGQYDHSGRIVYKRRVTLGKSSEDVDLIEKQPEVKNTLFQKSRPYMSMIPSGSGRNWFARSLSWPGTVTA